MGYYTDYTMSFDCDDGSENLIMDFLEKDEMLCCLYPDLFCSAKWYDCDKDMIRLSKKFPNVLFHLHGDGEDSDDLWEAHYKNGKYQFCRAEIPPYDPSLMSEYREPPEFPVIGDELM